MRAGTDGSPVILSYTQTLLYKYIYSQELEKLNS